MNSNMIGLINMREDHPLQEINDTRPLSTLPIGGKYRLIDFTLSNMVNAGIENVGLLLSSQSRSVLDHIRSGKEWGLAHKGDGLFYLPEERADIEHPVEGDIAAYYKNLIFVQRANKRYALLSGCDMVRTSTMTRSSTSIAITTPTSPSSISSRNTTSTAKAMS